MQGRGLQAKVLREVVFWWGYNKKGDENIWNNLFPKENAPLATSLCFFQIIILMLIILAKAESVFWCSNLFQINSSEKV